MEAERANNSFKWIKSDFIFKSKYMRVSYIYVLISELFKSSVTQNPWYRLFILLMYLFNIRASS